MKKLVSILITLLLGISVFVPAVAAEGLPEVSCEAYVVMDAESGQIIMEKNPDKVLYPASITKVMTLGLTMEKAQGDWNTELTIDYDVAHSMEAQSSHIALLPGEVVRLEDVIYATQMESANDGANALAEYFGEDGTIQSGVDRMNQKAAELGLQNTHYMNPHGLHDEQHYTTARDMAKVTRWAMGQPGFQEVFCRKDEWKMGATNLQPERAFHCTDWIRVGGPKLFRDYVKGGKTGFHNQAGHTYICYAQQGDVHLISIVLKAQGQNAEAKDTGALLDYAFANYHRKTLPAAEERHIIPVIAGGSESLGNVVVKAEGGASVLLHDSLSIDNITVEYDVPEKYLVGQPFSASVRYFLPENEVQPAELGSAELQVSGLNEVLQANTYIPQKQLDSNWNYLGIAVGVTGAAMVLLLIVRLIRQDGGLQKVAAKKAKNTGLPADFEIITRSRPENTEAMFHIVGSQKKPAKRSPAHSKRRRR